MWSVNSITKKLLPQNYVYVLKNRPLAIMFCLIRLIRKHPYTMNALFGFLYTIWVCQEMLNSSQSFVLSSSRNYVCAYHFLPFKSTGNLVVGHFLFCYFFSPPSSAHTPQIKVLKAWNRKAVAHTPCLSFLYMKRTLNLFSYKALPKAENFPSKHDT